MSWEKIKDFKVGRFWPHSELREHFVAVQGGVALPDKQPGFAVVAGLRPVRERGENYRIHVLAEFESSDPLGLLRQCAAFSRKYNLRYLENENFRWVGDGKNTALQAIADKINDERRSPHSTSVEAERDRLLIDNARIFDPSTKTPYLYLVPELHEYLDPARRQLFLQDSTLEERLKQIQTAEELAELEFGSSPAIEALSFVVQELRHKADSILGELEHPSTSYERDWDPLDI